MPNKMMKNSIVVLCAAMILGCSAGGGETGTGFDGPVDDRVTVGVITGFGSVYVNGVKYETTDADISIGGTSSVETSLGIGMLVNLTGSLSNDGISGKASSISYEENVEGIVIENNMATSGRLDVMGQIIAIDNDTIFESNQTGVAAIDAILPGQVVNVSGYSSGDGVIYATRVSLEKLTYTAGEEIKVKGVASSVTSDQFTIGKLTFSYSSNSLKDFEDVVFSDGQFVSIKSIGDLDANNNYIATKISYKKSGVNGLVVPTGQEIELEGYINESINLVTNIFSVNGHKIKIDNENTKLSLGSKDQLIKGVKVKLEGVVGAQGEIVANEIEHKQESNRQFEGEITSINKADNAITVSNQIILINSSTRLKDERDDREEDEIHYFKFDDLVVGDFVELSAYKSNDVQFTATRLKRDEQESFNQNGDWELEGEVTRLDPLTIDDQVVTFSNGEFTGRLGDEVELHGVFDVNGAWVVTEYSANEEWEIEEGVIESIDLDAETIIVAGREIDISNIVFDGALQDVVDIEGITIEGKDYAIELEVKDKVNDEDASDEDESANESANKENDNEEDE